MVAPIANNTPLCHGYDLSVTLIIGVLSHDYVALASDRCLTWYDGAAYRSEDDQATKAFFLHGSLLMGYTGLARWNNTSMHAWVTETLVDIPADQCLEALTRASTILFQDLGCAGQEPHAFLAVGFVFVSNDPTRQLHAVLCTVSNCVRTEDGLDFSRVNPEFALHVQPLRNRPHLVVSVGVPLPDGARQELETRVEQLVRDEPQSPGLIVEPLVAATVSTSEQNAGVGRIVLCATLPRAGASQTYIDTVLVPLPASDPMWGETCLALTVDRRPNAGTAAPVFYTPSVVLPGLAITDAITY